MIIDERNKWVESQYVEHHKIELERQAETSRLELEIERLMSSLAAGVDPGALKEQIDTRIDHKNKLIALRDVSIPEAITAKKVEEQVRAVRQIAESRDPDRKCIGVRRYIAAMEG